MCYSIYILLRTLSRSATLILIMGMTTLLLSCNEAAVTSPELDAHTAAIAATTTASKGEAPPASGPIVIRTQTSWGFWYADPESGLSVMLGVNDIKFCTTGDPDFATFELQEVDVPGDDNRVKWLLKGTSINTSVWPFTTFDCNLFLNVEPVARGVSDLVFTDNDYYAWQTQDNINVDAYGFAARGELTNYAGRSFKFRGHLRCVWDNIDFINGRCEDQILLIP